MGCIGYIVEELTKLKKRKTLKEFKIDRDAVIRVMPIEKHKKIAIVMSSQKIVFLDYSSEKMKVKYEAQLGPVKVLWHKFTESNDTLELKYFKR